MNTDSHEFLVKTNKEVDEWMDSFYTDGRAGSFRSHCQWAWQEQERRKEIELSKLREGIAFVEKLLDVAGDQPSVATGYLRDILEVLRGEV